MRCSQRRRSVRFTTLAGCGSVSLHPVTAWGYDPGSLRVGWCWVELGDGGRCLNGDGSTERHAQGASRRRNQRPQSAAAPATEQPTSSHDMA